MQSDDMIYMFSDGYFDQIGGPENKRLFFKRFKDILRDVAKNPTVEQQEKLKKEMLDWKGDRSQTDDILILGIKV